VQDTLGDRAVLLDAVPAARTGAAASLRFGPDGKLFAAFDAGGDPRRIGDLGSYNGKILRLNADGSTPSDQPMATPVYAYGYSAPRGLDWQSGTRALWVVGRDSQDVGRLRIVAPNEVESVLGARGTSDALPQTANPLAMAFYRGDLLPSLRGDLLVAGGYEPTITRIKFNSRNPAHIIVREPLLENVGGIISTLAVSPEGAIYFCVDDELMRLVAGRSR
jgi:glucose/arabinose dehydrogenase